MKLSSFAKTAAYTRSQRTGLFALLTLIVAFQLVYFFVDFTAVRKQDAAEIKWLALKTVSDSIPPKDNKPKRYPFNPNFITDFKGYMLGMSTVEIDRLLAFRKTNRYVNSADEFQAVTQVSDSLLAAIKPYFKFPDWVKNRKKGNHFEAFKKPEPVKQSDINSATAEDLKKVYGIGDGLSQRILKEKEKLGGFVSMEQMKDVWGLSDEVIENLNKNFKIEQVPQLNKIKINTASVKELTQFPYFRYTLAKSVVTYRTMNGEIKNAEDLIKISGFPVDKVGIIALYLEF